jgi:hypothetical protein
LVVILLGLPACQVFQNLAATSTATATPEPTITLTPTRTPRPSQDELKTRWRPVFHSVMALGMTCQIIVEAAEGLTGGEIDEAQAVDDLTYATVLLGSLSLSLESWEPDQRVSSYKEVFREYLDEMEDVLSDWSKAKISTADVPDLLAETCQTIDDTLSEIIEFSNWNGLTHENIRAVAAEFDQAIDAMIEAYLSNEAED